MTTLMEQADAEISAAEAILAAVPENRDFTPAQQLKFDEHVDKARELQRKALASSKAARQRHELVGLGPDEARPSGRKQPYSTAEKGFLAPQYKQMAEHITSLMTPYGAKALAPSGTITVNVPMVTESPIELGRAAQTLYDLIPTVLQKESNYSYLRQTVRTNAAAPVASGATKPTSIYTIAKVDARLRVVAHLSEAIDKFMLEDNVNLVSFVQNEMIAGLYEAISTQILTGDGLGENLTGLANTSGIQLQAAGVDKLRTLRSALTKIENVNVAARGFALNAADWEQVEATRNASGNFDVGGPVDAATRRAWGVPVSVVPGLAVGTAYLIGEDTVTLRQQSAGVQIDWASPGATFEANQLKARCETRVNLDVERPVGIVKITLPV